MRQELKNVRPTCLHGKLKTYCGECGGGSICEHGKQKHRCKDFHGVSVCEHDRIKHESKDCHGYSICEHNKKYCKECHGSDICEHDRLKNKCKQCKGSKICEQNKLRPQCPDCNGSQFCDHIKLKHRCPDCNGSSICKANGEPYNSGCRTLGNPKYDKFSTHCFANLFPDDPRTLTIQNKSKALQVVAHIASTYDGFVHDRLLYVDIAAVQREEESIYVS